MWFEIVPNQYRRMSRTLVEYPFETSLIMDETLELGTVFGLGHQLAVSYKLVDFSLTFLNVLEPVITALERYEKSIFERFDSSSLQLRNVLRYERPEHLAGTPDPAKSHPPVRDTYDALCGLIASFRLVEKWATWDKLVEAPETGSVPKQLNEELVVKYNVCRLTLVKNPTSNNVAPSRLTGSSWKACKQCFAQRGLQLQAWRLDHPPVFLHRYRLILSIYGISPLGMPNPVRVLSSRIFGSQPCIYHTFSLFQPHNMKGMCYLIYPRSGATSSQIWLGPMGL
jgi:hypothetical protein